jgi:hypothetical protein
MPLSKASITSDFDYLKLVQDATLSITTTTPSDSDFASPYDPFGGFGSGEQGIVTVTHNLGFIPFVRAYIDSGNNGHWYGSYQQNGYIQIDPNLLTLVSTSTLKLCVNSSSHKSSIPVYYRLYKPTGQAATSSDRIDKIFMKSDPAAPSQIILSTCAISSDNVQGLVTIPHNQNEAICWTMQFSQDGVSWYNDADFIYGPPDTNSGPPGGPYAYYYYCRAYASGDSTNFYILFEHNYPSNKTIYARWALDYRA